MTAPARPPIGEWLPKLVGTLLLRAALGAFVGFMALLWLGHALGPIANPRPDRSAVWHEYEQRDFEKKYLFWVVPAFALAAAAFGGREIAPGLGLALKGAALGAAAAALALGVVAQCLDNRPFRGRQTQALFASVYVVPLGAFLGLTVGVWRGALARTE